MKTLYGEERIEKDFLEKHFPKKEYGYEFVGPANVSFGKAGYAQLGTGRAKEILTARKNLKNKYPNRFFDW